MSIVVFKCDACGKASGPGFGRWGYEGYHGTWYCHQCWEAWNDEHFTLLILHENGEHEVKTQQELIEASEQVIHPKASVSIEKSRLPLHTSEVQNSQVVHAATPASNPSPEVGSTGKDTNKIEQYEEAVVDPQQMISNWGQELHRQPELEDDLLLEAACDKLHQMAMRDFLCDRESWHMTWQTEGELQNCHSPKADQKGAHKSLFDFDNLDEAEANQASLTQELLMSGLVEYYRRPENIAKWVSSLECQFGDRLAAMVRQVHMETFHLVPLADWRFLSSSAAVETPRCCQEHAQPYMWYSVRLLLDAPPEVVSSAVVATLHDQPCRADDATHAEFFEDPQQPLREEWANYGQDAMLMPEASWRETFASISRTFFYLGFKPLRRCDYLQPIRNAQGECKGLFSAITAIDAQYWLNGLQAQDGIHPMQMCYITNCFVEEVVADGTVAESSAERVFNIKLVFGPQSRWILIRCTVRPVTDTYGHVRTEVIREIFQLHDCKSSARTKKIDETIRARGAQKLISDLEEEGRQWAKANDFEVIEAWRGLRTPLKHLYDWIRTISATRCLCTGEGAAASCERETGLYFDIEYARRLTLRFPHQRVSDRMDTFAPDHDVHFTEGSVLIEGFAVTLDRICRRSRLKADIFRSFVDLGSGCGNAVIAAHALFPFRACRGIELMRGLVDLSYERAKVYMNSLDFKLSKGPKKLTPRRLFEHGDIFETEWHDASVVLCNAATWPNESVVRVFRLALKLQPGSVLLLLSYSKMMPPYPEFLEAFDFRADAVMVSWLHTPCALGVYQRI